MKVLRWEYSIFPDSESYAFFIALCAMPPQGTNVESFTVYNLSVHTTPALKAGAALQLLLLYTPQNCSEVIPCAPLLNLLMGRVFILNCRIKLQAMSAKQLNTQGREVVAHLKIKSWCE